jgi:hypothetical protein
MSRDAAPRFGALSGVQAAFDFIDVGTRKWDNEIEGGFERCPLWGLSAGRGSVRFVLHMRPSQRCDKRCAQRTRDGGRIVLCLAAHEF